MPASDSFFPRFFLVDSKRSAFEKKLQQQHDTAPAAQVLHAPCHLRHSKFLTSSEAPPSLSPFSAAWLGSWDRDTEAWACVTVREAPLAGLLETQAGGSTLRQRLTDGVDAAGGCQGAVRVEGHCVHRPRVPFLRSKPSNAASGPLHVSLLPHTPFLPNRQLLVLMHLGQEADAAKAAL